MQIEDDEKVGKMSPLVSTAIVNHLDSLNPYSARKATWLAILSSVINLNRVPN